MADNRERIVRAARALVADGGFRDAQIAAIALGSDVSVGTIYRYFPSKAALYAEVVGDASRLEIEALTAIASTEAPAVQRLADAVCTFARRAIRAPRLTCALVAEPVEPEIDVARLEYRRALARVFEQILADGIAAGDFPPQDVTATAACLVGALIEGVVGPLVPASGAAQEDGEALVEAIALFCLRGVSGKND